MKLSKFKNKIIIGTNEARIFVGEILLDMNK